MSEAKVMGSERGRSSAGVFFDLGNFIAESGGVFVTLCFDGLGKFGLKLGNTVVDGLAGKGGVWDFADMGHALMHVLQHRIDHVLEGFVARRAAKAAVFFEIERGEPAFRATRTGRLGGRFGLKRSFDQQIRE